MTALAAVIPCGPGRAENLRLCLAALRCQTRPLDEIIVVFDGHGCDIPLRQGDEVFIVAPEKWRPGLEQPRNTGARAASADAVWFVDSDILMAPGAAEALLARWKPGSVCVGPYDWMGPGFREPQPDLHNDPRWPMFREGDHPHAGELNVGLGCFGGNLMWDRERFLEVGGFWNEIHRGEDGELGLRAVALDVPIRCVADARGWHLWHEVDTARIYEENARNVPMIDARHPYVKDRGLLVVNEDGKRFDVVCPHCKSQMNTLIWWGHRCHLS